MVVKVHGGILDDQSLVGSLRYFDIEETNMTVNAVGNAGGRVVSADVVTGGTSYAVSNVLTVSGGTFSTAATLTVGTIGPGGAVTGVSISNPGAYTVLPANPVSVTGGAGSAATFNLSFSSTVIIPGAAIGTGGPEFYVSYGKAVVNSVVDRVLRVVAERATIVQIAIIDADTVRVVVENEGFSWDTPAAGTAAEEMEDAIQALAVIGGGAAGSNNPPVPNTTAGGTTFNLSAATVTERTFASLA